MSSVSFTNYWLYYRNFALIKREAYVECLAHKAYSINEPLFLLNVNTHSVNLLFLYSLSPLDSGAIALLKCLSKMFH